MFENVIGQDQVITDLRRDILSKKLPSSLLFHGPDYSGKLTTALELSRILTCEKGDALWNCSCSSCRKHRLLTHPNNLLLGSRYFKQDIAACGDTLAREPRDAAKYLFIRSVRKLTRRFDPILWEGDEAKLSGIAEAVQDTEELLEELYPGKDMPNEENLQTIVVKIIQVTEKISNAIPDNIPINMIRNIIAWSHRTASGSAKIVILENADRMMEGSRNSLLKALEEPPVGVYYILTTSRRGAIIPTILSRLRPYPFRSRNKQQNKEIFRRIFRIDDNGIWNNLADFFRDRRLVSENTENTLLLHKAAELFVKGVYRENISETRDLLAEVENALKTYPFREGYRYFLEILTGILTQLLKEKGNDPAEVHRHMKWNRYIHEVLQWREIYNVNQTLCLENLFFRMREAA
jgi:DNA polymerase III delta prime subunit